MNHLNETHLAPSARGPLQNQENAVAATLSADATIDKTIPVEVAVFDEAMWVSQTVYDKPPVSHKSRISSSGTPDILLAYPWQPNISFTDRNKNEAVASAERSLIEIDRRGKSPSYLDISSTYNGLQRDHEDFGVKAPEAMDELRLIVDLSSQPHIHAAMTREPIGKRRTEADGRTGEIELRVREYRRHVYVVEAENVQQGEAIFLDLDLDWDAV